jgi:hypothetical protein
MRMTVTLALIVGGIVAICAAAIIASMLIDIMRDGDEPD